MQRAVFAAEGRPYDAAGTVPANAVAEALVQALDAPASATWTDLDVRAS